MVESVSVCKKIKDSPSAVYIRELLKSFYFDFITFHNSRGGTQKFIALGDMQDFQIFVPPRNFQGEFIDVVKKFERLKVVQVEPLRQAEHLFQSLPHQAFSDN